MNQKGETTKVQSRLTWLKSHFLNRVDILSSLAPWGKPQPVKIKNIDEALTFHLTGIGTPPIAETASSSGKTDNIPISRLGAYCPNVHQVTKWTCIDIDGGLDHSHSCVDPDLVVDQALINADANGVPVYTEKSKSGQGYHLWVFFECPVTWDIARRIGLLIAPRNVPLTNGKRSDVSKAQGIEVFPKGQVHKEGGTGTMVWLPWHYKDKLGGFEPDIELDIITCSMERAAHLASLHKEVEHPKPRRQASDVESLDVWVQWKREVFGVVDLHSIYHLTGKKNGRWEQARMPGESHASASVNPVGSNRAIITDHRTGDTYNPIDYLIEFDGLNFESATTRLSELTGIKKPDLTKRPNIPPITTEPNLPTIDRVKRQAGRGGDSQPVLKVVGAPDPELPPIPDCPPNDHAGDMRVAIDVNNDDLVQVEQCWKAVNDASYERLRFFNSGGIPMIRDGDNLSPLTESDARGELITRCRFFKYRAQDNAETPKSVSNAVVSAFRGSARRLAKPIKGIVKAPMFLEDGSLLDSPGYDPNSELFYYKSVDHGDINYAADKADCDAALELLTSHMLADFRLHGIESRAHMLACIIQPFVREMFDGPSPLYVFSAPKPNSGKSLLASSAQMIYEGRARTFSIKLNGKDSHDNNKKALTSKLASNSRGVVFMDNVRGAVSSEILEMMITSDEFEDRIVGSPKQVTVLNRALWMMTSNNPKFNLDSYRRMLPVLLDGPPKDKEFAIKMPFLVWVRKNRGRLINSVLTIVQYWVNLGMPRYYGRVLDSFEDYSSVMGGILECAGISGFLKKEAYNDSEHKDFLMSWYDALGDREVKTGEVLRRVLDSNLHLLPELSGVLGGSNQRSKVVSLGRFLSKIKEQNIDGYRVNWSPSTRCYSVTRVR